MLAQMLSPLLLQSVQEVVKAKVHKYISRHRKNSRWVYRYPRKGESRHSKQAEVKRSGLEKVLEALTVGAKIASGPEQGHYTITHIDGDRITFYIDEDSNGNRGKSATVSASTFKNMIRNGHADAFERAAVEGLKRREAVLQRAAKAAEGRNTPALARARNEIERWRESHKELLARPALIPPLARNLTREDIFALQRSGAITSWEADFLGGKRFKPQSKFSDKQKAILQRIQAKFEEHFDELPTREQQRLVIAGTDPRENEISQAEARQKGASLGTPKGMERFEQSGKSFHEYQKEFIGWVTNTKRGVGAMETGLGKTLTTIAGYHHLKEKGEVDRMIVVAPNSAQGSWKKELAGNSDARVGFLTGTPKKRAKVLAEYQSGNLDILITTYDTARIEADGLVEATDIKTMFVMDEAHYLKNPGSKRSIAIGKVAAGSGRALGLTATPQPNHPVELYTVVDTISPGRLGKNKWSFAYKYCNVEEHKFGKDITGYNKDKAEMLRQDLEGVMFVKRRNDSDVNIAMPDRHQVNVQIGMDPKTEKLYAATLAEFEDRVNRYYGEKDRYDMELGGYYAAREAGVPAVKPTPPEPLPQGAHLTLINDLRQISISPALKDPKHKAESIKIASIADGVKNHLDAQPERGAVVFGEYNQGLQLTKQALLSRGFQEKDIAFIDGSVTGKKREQIQEDLNSGKLKVLLANTKAMQTGANLQGNANFVALVDTPYNPSSLTQAIDRVHRQGQKHKVTVFHPISSPIEEKQMRVIQGKLNQSSIALGGHGGSEESLAESLKQPQSLAEYKQLFAELGSGLQVKKRKSVQKALIAEVVKAIGHLYKRRWRGADGRYRYEYATDSSGRKRGDRHSDDHTVSEKKLLGKDEHYHVGASFSAGKGKGHLRISHIFDDGVMQVINDETGELSQFKSKKELRSHLKEIHKEAIDRHARAGLKRREATLAKAEKLAEGRRTPALARAEKELARWKAAHQHRLPKEQAGKDKSLTSMDEYLKIKENLTKKDQEKLQDLVNSIHAHRMIAEGMLDRINRGLSRNDEKNKKVIEEYKKRILERLEEVAKLEEKSKQRRAAKKPKKKAKPKKKPKVQKQQPKQSPTVHQKEKIKPQDRKHPATQDTAKDVENQKKRLSDHLQAKHADDFNSIDAQLDKMDELYSALDKAFEEEKDSINNQLLDLHLSINATLSKMSEASYKEKAKQAKPPTKRSGIWGSDPDPGYIRYVSEQLQLEEKGTRAQHRRIKELAYDIEAIDAEHKAVTRKSDRKQMQAEYDKQFAAVKSILQQIKSGTSSESITSSSGDHGAIYDWLGLKKNATNAELKEAWKEKSKKHHPDKGGSVEAMQRINVAYNILKNPRSRKKYDRHGSYAQAQREIKKALVVAITKAIQKACTDPLYRGPRSSKHEAHL